MLGVAGFDKFIGTNLIRRESTPQCADRGRATTSRDTRQLAVWAALRYLVRDDN